MELWEAGTGTADLLVELTVALIASKTGHVFHIINGFFVENGHFWFIWLFCIFRIFADEKGGGCMREVDNLLVALSASNEGIRLHV